VVAQGRRGIDDSQNFKLLRAQKSIPGDSIPGLRKRLKIRALKTKQNTLVPLVYTIKHVTE
jgi:hypothetical protein